MATSIIKVYNVKYGQWERNAKVVLSWDGLINLGMSDPVYTDSSGTAVISHSATGTATIYVNGSKKETMNTPGSATIQI